MPCQWEHEDGGLTRPGELPAGDYTTAWFFPGRMTVTLPGGWSSGEDSTGELALASPTVPDGVLLFWLDVMPIAGHRVPAENVPSTAAGVEKWLLGNEDITVTRKGTAALGSGLVARTLDLHVSRSAKNYAGPNCPTSACVYLFAMDPMWDSIQQEDGPGETDSGWAIGRDISYVRLYLMTLETAEHGQHLFLVAQAAPTPGARTAMTKAAAPLLASLCLPVGVS